MHRTQTHAVKPSKLFIASIKLSLAALTLIILMTGVNVKAEIGEPEKERTHFWLF